MSDDAKEGMGGSNLFGDPHADIRHYEVKNAELESKLAVIRDECDKKLASEAAKAASDAAKAEKKHKKSLETIRKLNGDNLKLRAEAKRAENGLIKQREELEKERRLWLQRKAGDSNEKKFDEFVATLSHHANTSTEQKWIAAHPAMRRGVRGTEGQNVVLRLQDIKEAPSRYAVNQLQRWCNQTPAFFAQSLAADRKAMVDEGAAITQDETPADWKDLQRMFDSMKTAREKADETR